MKENNGHIDQLIADFLTGRAGKERVEELEKWVEASAGNYAYFCRGRELWFSALTEEEAAKYDKERAFSLFRKRVEEAEGSAFRHRSLVRYLRYAAAVAVVVAVGALAYWQGGVAVKDHFADISVEAPLGSRTKLCLPDGTLVWLNAGSRMTYSQGFGVDNRDVSIEGEGYFEVAHNAALPFRVESKDMHVQVLGTKFNFRDYPDDREVVVALLEGKVALRNQLKEEPEAYLHPDERMLLDKRSGRMKVERKSAAMLAQWTEGYLSFDERLLPDIVKELERSYGVDIRIENPKLESYRFYGNFSRQEQSIREVLDALSATGDFHYHTDREQHTISIY